MILFTDKNNTNSSILVLLVLLCSYLFITPAESKQGGLKAISISTDNREQILYAVFNKAIDRNGGIKGEIFFLEDKGHKISNNLVNMFGKSPFIVKTDVKVDDSGNYIDKTSGKRGTKIIIRNLKMLTKSKAIAFCAILNKFSEGVGFQLDLNKNGKRWKVNTIHGFLKY